jgi:hypothetical protein
MGNRAQVDVEKEVTKAMPAAGASADTDSIDLGENPGQLENVEVEIDIPALPALVATKDVTIHLEDSADDSSFADVSELASQTITGATGNGAAATKFHFRVPRAIRRYIRANIAVETGGGDNTGVTAALRLVF